MVHLVQHHAFFVHLVSLALLQERLHAHHVQQEVIMGYLVQHPAHFAPQDNTAMFRVQPHV